MRVVTILVFIMTGLLGGGNGRGDDKGKRRKGKRRISTSSNDSIASARTRKISTSSEEGDSAKKLMETALKLQTGSQRGKTRAPRRPRQPRAAPEQASVRSGEIPLFTSRRREILKGQQKKEPKEFIKPESFSFEQGVAGDLIQHAKNMHQWKMNMRGAQPTSK